VDIKTHHVNIISDIPEYRPVPALTPEVTVTILCSDGSSQICQIIPEFSAYDRLQYMNLQGY
jgi:hypothetical protein